MTGWRSIFATWGITAKPVTLTRNPLVAELWIDNFPIEAAKREIQEVLDGFRPHCKEDAEVAVYDSTNIRGGPIGIYPFDQVECQLLQLSKLATWKNGFCLKLQSPVKDRYNREELV